MTLHTARDVIHDTHATSVDDTPLGDNGNYIHLSTSEFSHLHSAFVQLGTNLHRSAYGVHFNGREYTVVPSQSHVSVHSGGGLRAELTLVHAGDAATRWIKLTYSLYVHGSGRRVLSFIGNPTTLVAGSNIRPVRVAGVGEATEYLTFFRIGFDFVCALFPAFSWSRDTARAIAAGSIVVSNTQWALYLPTANRERDMALLTGLYCSRLNAQYTSCALGEYLGFHASAERRDNKTALDGLFLTKRRGRHHVLTINFYDKRQSVANKHQGMTLSADEAELLAHTIRLDITAHTAWLDTMIRAAKAQLHVIETVRPGGVARFADFLNATSPTAATVARAMNILGWTVEDGVAVQRGFTAWLVRRVLEDELRLVSLLRCTLDVLDVVHADPTCSAALVAWRTHPDVAEPLVAVERACGCSARHARRLRDRLLSDCAVDIAIPYGYWLDYLAASLTYGTDATERAAVIRAVFVSGGDPAERVATLDSANARRARALADSRTSLLHSLALVAREVEATPLVAEPLRMELVEAGCESLWTDPRVEWTSVHT